VNAIVAYWSVSGTTRRVAECIAEGIRAEGAECVLYDLRAGPPDHPSGYDLVGVGSPVHYYRLPAPTREALAALGSLEGRSAFGFTLNSTYRGAGLNELRTGLARAGATEVGTFACHGRGRFVGYLRLGYEYSTGHPTDADLDAARRFGADVVRAHRGRAQGAYPPASRPRDPHTHVVYALERAVTAPWLARSVYSRFFRADRRRCTKCGICRKVCPTGNVSWERGEWPRWGRNCIICGECALSCPEDAVRCPYDWPVFAPFMRYNVRRAGRDPGLDVARVEIRKGKVVKTTE
jgi:flavodoxin/ferredoxin